MNKSLTLTVITPVFNGEKYIVETIDSVLSANISCSFEYIVINDGSTDSTLKLLKTFGRRISLYSQTNIGEAASVNRGLEYAKGKFVMVLSADDPMLQGNLVEKALSLFHADEQIVAVYPDWNVIDEEGQVLKTNLLSDYSEDEMLGKSKCLPGPGVIFLRSAALDIGGRNPKWKYVSDFDFWLRLSRKGRIAHLPEVLAQWRANDDSTSISQRNQRMASERIWVIEEFLRENIVSKDLERRALGSAYYLAARLSFFDSAINGRQLIIKALKYRKGIPEECRIRELIFLLFFPISMTIIRKLPRRLVNSLTKR